MKPNISEFSYGYALTEDLIRWSGTLLTAAPVFPSLIEEGKAGGGYDVRLDFQGVPLFLQFKLSHRLESLVRTKERKQDLFKAPFYRMYLRPLRHSKQHAMLLDLEKTGSEVYYVAPIFHEAAELNRAYVGKKVADNSIFVRPSEIGTLPTQNEHHLAFQSPDIAYLLPNSVPQPIRLVQHTEIAKRMTAKPEQATAHILESPDRIADLNRQMIDIVQRHLEDHGNVEVLNNIPSIQSIAYLAHTFFDCEMLAIRQQTS